MQRYIALIAAALILSGCAVKNRYIDEKSALEESYLFNATYLENSRHFKEAALFYEKLYKIDPNKIYLIKVIENLIKAKEYDKALAFIEEAKKRGIEDWKLHYYAANIYIAKKDYEKAKKELFRALKLSRDYRIYELLGSLYLAQKDYEKALKFYKSAYAQNPDSTLVSTIAYIMYFYLNRQNEALAYLESHIRIYGCDKKVCLTLASMYSLKNDINGLISVYKRLYEKYREKEYAKKLIQFLIYEKDYDQAIRYAKAIGDDEMLLDLYRIKKDYKNAYRLAKKLYELTSDVKYLGLMAIFEYESSDKKSRDVIMDVAKKLEKVIKKKRDPLYLNYLGYLYIDHDIDVKRGIELVKEALKMEPDSPYYLDSLAWGYYKIGRCEEALKIIKRVYYELNQRDDEVKFHLDKILECVKERD